VRNGVTYSLVGVEDDASGRVIDEPDGQGHDELTGAGPDELTPSQPCLQQMKLGF
jgi:hypothetical protein